MSTPAAASTASSASAYWRAAGMSYMAYANACATALRRCLKEPHKTQSTTREAVHYKVSKWDNGVQQASEIRGVDADKD